MRCYKYILAGGCIGSIIAACTPRTSQVEEWVTTTYTTPWVKQEAGLITHQPSDSIIVLDTEQTAQTIDGFGTCFNELGWTSLSVLDIDVREGIIQELFSREGMNLTINRMPIGANDFSLDYYSYNDTEGDFEMKNFSINHDETTLIPFVKAALQVNPNFKLWASPWTPPAWMKKNKHYACITKMIVDPNSPKEEENNNPLRFRMVLVNNGLDEANQISAEGTDMLIQEEEYLKAYALYFGKFIDAYKERGIDISMVMPQNEPNSAQPYPTCLWSYKGLGNFIKHLGPEMNKRGVDIFLGTIERGNPALPDSVLTNPEAAQYVKGCGFQWAGKDALPVIHKKYPNMPLYQTEQECGNGLNNWEGAMHSWNLMKHYLNNGVNAYLYWNTSLLEGGVSRWGWMQNSLVVVNDTTRTYKYTPEAYILKHVSHYVLPGAKRLQLKGNYNDALAFVNKDGSMVAIIANQNNHDYPVSIQCGERVYSFPSKAYSIQSVLIKSSK